MIPAKHSTARTTNEEARVPDNPNQITPENSALVLIDHQPWVMFSVKSIDTALLANNVAGLAACAQAIDVPIVLTTVGAEGGTLRDPMIKALADLFPDVTPIDRVSTNAWEEIREAVVATGRKVLVIAGVWTEVCLAQTSISAMAEGYRVFFVSDCSGGTSEEAHEDAKARLVQAGATPINWFAAATEWTPDFTTAVSRDVIPAMMKAGATAGLSLEYGAAQRERPAK